MRFTERREYYYDAELCKSRNTERALKMHAEYIAKYCPEVAGRRPRPQFFEMDRQSTKIDPLWHVSLSDRPQFTSRSPITLPALNTFQRPDWRLTRVGLVPARKDNFYLANLHLQQVDYFPNRGDQVFWDGYRYTIMNVVIPPEAYFGPTNIWMGLVCECVIAPQGDAKPLDLQALQNLAPAEREPRSPVPTPQRPDPRSFPDV